MSATSPGIPQSQVSGVVTTRFCLRCQTALPEPEKDEGECLQCGLQFLASDEETFFRERMFLWWRYWLPGFSLAVATGVISYAVLLMLGDMGTALFFAVPLSSGVILGYATRVQTWLLAVLGVMAVVSMAFALISMNLAGIFCGAMLGAIFLIPMFVGMVMGVALRLILAATNWDQRWFLSRWVILAGVILLPYPVQLIELCITRPVEVETVRTTLTIDSTPQEAWDAVMFYEEVGHDPPWLLRFALPQPVRTQGDKQKVGEVVRCVYRRGHLCKQITGVTPQRRLAFKVTEQEIHFERDVKLLDGSFEFTPAPGGGVNVTLTTRYQRKLHPRWLWITTEREVVHTLHEHVLRGMKQQAEGAGKPASTQPPAVREHGPLALHAR